MHAFFCAVSFVLGKHTHHYPFDNSTDSFAVYFIYPETANLRLEDMDALFGDATTAMPTPAQHAEIESLMARSPVPSLDIRRPRQFGADAAIPGLDIDPPQDGGENGKGPLPDTSEEPRSEGLGGWISRMMNRTKSGDKGSNSEAGAYRRLDQEDD